MNREEAQKKLDACTLRPGDAEAEARAFADQDPVLGDWLKKRTDLDEKIADTLAETPVPSGLNERLLAAMMAEAAEPPVKTRATGSTARMTWLALAAIVTLSGVGLWWNAQPKWEQEALAIAAQLNAGQLSLDVLSPDLSKLKNVLVQAQAPTPEQLPQDLTALSPLGCKVIQIQGQPASVVCFQITPQQIAHLVTFSTVGLSKAPAIGNPRFTQEGEWNIAIWRVGNQGHFLATKADAPTLERLFAWLQALDWMRFLA